MSKRELGLLVGLDSFRSCDSNLNDRGPYRLETRLMRRRLVSMKVDLLLELQNTGGWDCIKKYHLLA